jgi:hypothetical protein
MFPPLFFTSQDWELLALSLNMELLSKGEKKLVAYEFYSMDKVGKAHLVGILPERRKDRDRITQESIMNWVKKVIGNGNFENNIFFSQVKID